MHFFHVSRFPTHRKTSRLALSEQVEIDFSRLGLDDNVALIVGLRPIATPQLDTTHTSPHTPASALAASQAAAANSMPQDRAPSPLRQRHDSPVAVPTPPPCVLLVSNTHLLFDPTKGDTKLGQLRVIMAQVSREQGCPRSLG